MSQPLPTAASPIARTSSTIATAGSGTLRATAARASWQTLAAFRAAAVPPTRLASCSATSAGTLLAERRVALVQ